MPANKKIQNKYQVKPVKPISLTIILSEDIYLRQMEAAINNCLVHEDAVSKKKIIGLQVKYSKISANKVVGFPDKFFLRSIQNGKTFVALLIKLIMGHYKDHKSEAQNADAEAHRDPAQSHHYKGEAQNVNDGTGRPLNKNEISHARNKANEGARQGRSEGGRSRSEKIY